jgi:hypothetical protein
MTQDEEIPIAVSVITFVIATCLLYETSGYVKWAVAAIALLQPMSLLMLSRYRSKSEDEEEP